MHRLMFVVPAHGRVGMARVCLRQLRRTCDALAGTLEASAIVIADDANLETARELGFGTVVRDNSFLSRKYNDGIQLALDPRYNPRPADFVVPFGTDDWIVPELFEVLPHPDEIIAFQRCAFVNESASNIDSCEVDYEAGVGIRIYPRAMLERLAFRPADEDRKRACDASILVNLKMAYRDSVPNPLARSSVNTLHRRRRDMQITYRYVHDFQIVDWKSKTEQLNTHSDIVNRFLRSKHYRDPFTTLAPYYPRAALGEMSELYGVA